MRRWIVVVSLVPATAWAELPPYELPSSGGTSLAVAGSVLGETAPRRDDQVTGELAVVAAWTRAGVDHTQGFRGPRWTKRWGARLELSAMAGSGTQPIELEERAEVAIYIGSIGQTIRWQSQPRLTDRFWYRTTDQLELGVFADFAGLGLVKRDGDEDMSCEAFPIHAEVTWGVTAEPITTTELDIAIARVANDRGDLRITDERLIIRDNGTERALAFDAAFFSARSVTISKHSPWRVSGAIGISALTPFSKRQPFDGESSIIPLVKIGIEHRSAPRIRSTRSAIGRPLLDDTDFGVELASMHRWVETAIDAGGQLTAWWQRPLTDGLLLRGEAMLGVGRRQLVISDSMFVTDGAVVLGRGELGLHARLGGGVVLETRVWAERSERTAHAMAPRWDAGLLSGLAWRN
jgi:hypothetical protein